MGGRNSALRGTKWAAMACLALRLGSHVHADTLYTYQGNRFTTIVFDPVFTNDSIQAELTFASPLPPNMALSTPDDLLAFKHRR
jgi:hypothetical protein